MQQFSFTGFRGLNRRDDISVMSPNFLYDLRNYYMDKTGALTERDGILKLNATATTSSLAILSIKEVLWASGSREVILQSGANWWSGGTDCATLTSIKGSLTTGLPFSLTMGNISGTRYAIISNGDTVPQKYDGSTVSNLTADSNCKKAKFVHMHQHKLWTFGNQTSGEEMYARFSKTDDITDFTTASDAGFLDFKSVLGEADTPTGIATFGDAYLVFFFRNNILIYTCGTDPTLFQLSQIINGVGAVSSHIQQIGRDLYFASKDGMRSLSQTVEVQKLDLMNKSRIIDSMYREIIAQDFNDLSQIHIVDDAKRNLALISIPYPSATHKVLVNNYALGQDTGWSYFDSDSASGVKFNSMCVLNSGKVYIGGNGYVYELFSGDTDDGTAYTTTISTPNLYFGSNSLNKKLLFFEPLIKFGSPTTSFSLSWWYGVDNRGASQSSTTISITGRASFWDVALWDVDYWDATGRYFKKIKMSGRGKMAQITVSRSKNNLPITLQYFNCYAVLQGIK